MEILKGFVFDLQRHTAINLSAADLSAKILDATGVAATLSTGNELVYLGADGNLYLGKKTGVTYLGTVKFTGATAATPEGSKITAIVLDSANTDGITIDGTSMTVGGTGVATTPFTIGTYSFTSGGFTTTASVLSGLSGTLNVTAGAAVLSENYSATMAVGATSVQYQNTVALDGTTSVTTGDGTVFSITGPAAARTITNTGNVVGALAATDSVKVTSAGASTFAINGATGLGTNGTVTFASGAAGAGITAVTGLAAGKSVSGVAPGIPVTTASTVTSGTYTVNGYQAILSGAGTGSQLQFTTATPGFDAISGLANGGILSVTNGTNMVGGVTVSAALVASKNLSSSGKITVNNRTYYAGMSAFASSGSAASPLGVYTATDRSYLVSGTAYLDGATAKSVEISSTTGTNARTVTATKGDISVAMSGTTGQFTVHDLDNGDSFTVYDGTNTCTYFVANGVLYKTDNAGATAAVAGSQRLTSSENSMLLAFATAGSANESGTGTLEANVYPSTGEPLAETKTIGLTINAGNGAVTPTIIVVGKTNYVTADGVVSTDSKNAVGSITYNSSSDVYTYNVLTATGQVVTPTDTNKWVVNGNNGADTLTGNNAETTLNGGNGSDTITAGAGNLVQGGAGNDSLFSAVANATLVGGAGVDTLLATNADTTLTGGDGADVFVLNDTITGSTGRGFISDYKLAEDVILDNSKNQAAIRAEATTATNFGVGGTFSLTGTGVVTIGATNGYYAVNVKGVDNKTQIFAWTGEEATGIDASSLKDDVIIINRNTVGDSLYGGSGNDTIYGGSGDTVYGGAGKNVIRLSTPVAGDETRTVGVGKGKDTITGFVAGFDSETADKLFLVGGVSSLASTLAGGTLNLKSGDAAVEMQTVATATSGGVEILAGDKKALFAASGATVSVSSASYADYYYGTKTAGVGSFLDASAIEDAVSIDLSNTSVFKNFTQVTGGQGKTTLMGSKENETLIAGIGQTSLYGGAGKDSLVGNSAAKDTYFMLAGGGNDSVSGFTYFDGENSDVADVVNMSAISSAKLVAGGVQLNVNDTDKILIEGATADRAIGYQVNGGTVATAKVGSVGASNSFTYLNGVNYYGGGTKVDTLSFASGDSDNHEVWLGDPSKGVTYNSVDVVDGSNSAGNLILAGDSAKNTIIGGTGNNSLWGGTGDAADTLRGGSSANVFFYGKGEGNDVIEVGSDSDSVNLYNIALSDVKSGEITSSAVNVEFQDGSKLTVNTGYRDVKFNLASGESYTANHNTGKWE